MPASAMRRPFQGLIDNGPACHLAEQARRIRGEAMGREGPGMMPVGRQGFGWPRDHPKEPRPLAEHDDRRRIDRVHYADFPNKSPWPYSSTRSEEHTSELPVTNAHLVCRLLLEKKNINILL